MKTAMLQFRQRGRAPSLKQVQRRFGLDASEIDAEYGVVQTDSTESLYVVRVDAAARPRIAARLKRLGLDDDPQVGIFADPQIEPMGTPEESEGKGSPFTMR